MAYRVGEVAEILGLSPQGVRFFEHRQYLKGHRSENGYRFYERRDLTVAQQIQDYATVGFTLKEAADMVLTCDLNTIEDRLEQCDARIEEKIRELEIRRQSLALRRQVAARVRQNRPVEIREEAAWLFLPLDGEGALPETSVKRRVEREWMRHYPHTMLARMPIRADGMESDSRGVCVLRQDAQALGLAVPDGCVLLPEALCWNAVICKPVGETKDYAALRRQAVQQGYRPIGPMLSIVEISLVRDGVRCTISQIRLPVEKIEKDTDRD